MNSISDPGRRTLLAGMSPCGAAWARFAHQCVFAILVTIFLIHGFPFSENRFPDQLGVPATGLVLPIVPLLGIGVVNLFRRARGSRGIRNRREAELLKRSEQKYRSLYRDTPVMMHSIDREGKLVSVSNFWLRSLGYERSEVIGRKSVEFLTPESRRYAEQVVLPAYFKAGVCRDVPYQLVKKNGELMDVLLSAIAEKDAAGKVTRSLAVLIDVTAQKEAERALRASEERLRILTETATDAIVSADSEGNIVQFNHSAERIFGWCSTEALGRPITDLMPERFRDAWQMDIERCQAGGEVRLIGSTVEAAGARKDGSEFPLELSLSTWETPEGRFFTAIFRDITRRKRAETELRRRAELIRLTAEGAGVGLWSWHVLENRLEWNSIEYEQCALEVGAKMDLHTFMECVHPEDRGRVKAEMENSLRVNHPLDMEYRVVWPDGSVRWRHCKGRPAYHQGRPVRLSGVSLDITRQKEAEEAMRQAHETIASYAQELERRVRERTAQLDRALNDMEIFLYSIAHDLRAPLRGMSGMSQALVEDYGPQLDDMARVYCQRIAGAAEKMNRLIADLLAFGRLSQRTFPIVPVKLAAEVQKVLSQAAIQIEQSGARIEIVDPLPEVCADAPVLDQILDNLLGNGLKFVPPGRRPHIRVWAESGAEYVRLWIEDNGIGIAPEDQQRIFGAFYRLHTEAAYPGTGMGLAIVQKGIERMGGRVGVESEPGNGSRFWIDLLPRSKCDNAQDDAATVETDVAPASGETDRHE